MKKIIYAVAVVLAALSVGCSGNSATVQDNERELKAKIENCTNQDSIEVYIEQAKQYAQSLADSGKTEEARRYMAELTPVVEKKAPDLKSKWTAAVDGVKDFTVSTADTVAARSTEVFDSVKAKSSDAKDAVTDRAEKVIDGTKDVAGKAVEGTKNVAGKVADKTKEGAEAVKDGTKKAVDKTKDFFEDVKDDFKK